MNPQLPAFIDALEARQLLVFDILGEEDYNFNIRFLIQKYVYLARKFGLDMDYRFSMYLHGPYSSVLAADYYRLAKIKNDDEEWYRTLASEDLNSLSNLDESFFDFVEGRDLEWLEAATTLLSLSGHITNRRRLIERTANMKE